MASATTTATTTVQAESWFKQHETLIISLVFLALLFFVADRYFNHADAAANKAVTQTQQVLTTQKTDNAEAAQALKVVTEQYSVLSTSLSAQNAKLTQAIATGASKLKAQQTADTQMTDPEVIARWKTLAKISDTDLTATSTGASITSKGATETLEELETIPQLQQEESFSQEEITNTQKELDAQNDIVTKQTADIAGLNKQIVDETKACNAQVDLVKADARKSKLKWFGAGFVSGLIVGIVK